MRAAALGPSCRSNERIAPLRPRHSFRSPISSTAWALRRFAEMVPRARHQSVRLLTPFRGMQTKMRGDDAQHSLADQEFGVDRPAGFLAGDG